jgi:phosphatidate cytidylyltransferase
LLHLYLVSVYPRQQDLWRNISTRTLAGLLILVPAWTAVVYLQGLSDQGPAYVLFLLLLIWCADTAAYFGGRAWGKRKLLVNVSPGKTWEGAGSALVAVGVLSWVGAHILGVAAEQLSVFIGLSLVTVLFSILGDLIESMYKRQAGLKDSGTLLPGHGGVLDRIDSLTAAAPIFVLGLLSSGILPQWQTL